jgi:hypothetical protein
MATQLLKKAAGIERLVSKPMYIINGIVDRRWILRWMVLFLVPLVFAGAVLAQQKSISWKCQQISESKFFLITDFGVDLPLQGNDTPGSISNSNFDLVWSLGIMRNVTRGLAIGLAVEATTEKIDFPIALKGRIKTWLNKDICLDVGFGRTIAAFNNDGISRHTQTHGGLFGAWSGLDGSGTTIDLGISLNNRIGLYLRHVSLPYWTIENEYNSLEQTERTYQIKDLHGGIRFQHKLGLATGLIVPVSYLVHAIVEARN